ncbi:hypothetical protein GCM10010412_098420 [Nonomuraea recticatena]|uniref:XRE family transcriptional regulator n=1 Tax=Nonomuraea recticatena TaxID=46178 RepID=A0ABP6FTG6_9ACTN
MAECEQHIANVTHQWLLGVGQALKAIRDHKLYEHTGYPSFDAYVSHRWDMTRQRAHQLIAALPIVELVAPYADREVKEGQTRVLASVYDAHGGEAVVEVWVEATRSGKPTAAALERIARARGYLAPAGGGKTLSRKDVGHPNAILEMREALRAFDLQSLRVLAAESPDAAEEIRVGCEQAGNALLQFASELAGMTAGHTEH